MSHLNFHSPLKISLFDLMTEHDTCDLNEIDDESILNFVIDNCDEQINVLANKSYLNYTGEVFTKQKLIKDLKDLLFVGCDSITHYTFRIRWFLHCLSLLPNGEILPLEEVYDFERCCETEEDANCFYTAVGITMEDVVGANRLAFVGLCNFLYISKRCPKN